MPTDLRRAAGALAPPLAAAVIAGVVICSSVIPAAAGSDAPRPQGVATVPVSATAHGPTSFYRPPDPLSPAPPGTLVRDQIVTGVPGIPPGDRVWRILYHSQTITGGDIAVSGYVVVPAAGAPPGGYPILAWAHGTTGAATKCAPSLFNGMEGEGPYLVPDIADYLNAGWLIAATDYQGLGVPEGVHPYLVGDSEGWGVLDAAKAARQLPHLRVSRTVLVYGHSQGGQAALFAGELAPSYAPSLQVIGVVAAAPATGLSTIVAVIGQINVPDDLAYFTLIGWTWSQTYPDLPASDVFTDSGALFARQIVTGHCDNGLVAALAARFPGTEFRSGASLGPVLVALAHLNNPGQVRTTAPVLIVQGTGDHQVPAPLTDLFVSRTACPMGDHVDYVHYPGATHDQIPFRSVRLILSWAMGRLDHRKAPDTCGERPDFTIGRAI